jgi:hypothetical protein
MKKFFTNSNKCRQNAFIDIMFELNSTSRGSKKNWF